MATDFPYDPKTDRVIGLRPLTKVDKPDRPPHVIALADAMRELSQLEHVPTMIVAWYSKSPEGSSLDLRFKSIGKDDEIMALCERVKFYTLIAAGTESELPTDG